MFAPDADKGSKFFVNRTCSLKNAMQCIHNMQQLSVVERAEQNSNVINTNDDVEGETCSSLRHRIIQSLKKIQSPEKSILSESVIGFILVYKFHFKMWVIRY